MNNNFDNLLDLSYQLISFIDTFVDKPMPLSDNLNELSLKEIKTIEKYAYFQLTKFKLVKELCDIIQEHIADNIKEPHDNRKDNINIKKPHDNGKDNINIKKSHDSGELDLKILSETVNVSDNTIKNISEVGDYKNCYEYINNYIDKKNIFDMIYDDKNNNLDEKIKILNHQKIDFTDDNYDSLDELMDTKTETNVSIQQKGGSIKFDKNVKINENENKYYETPNKKINNKKLKLQRRLNRAPADVVKEVAKKDLKLKPPDNKKFFNKQTAINEILKREDLYDEALKKIPVIVQTETSTENR